MKKIKIMAICEAEITDEEYKHIRNLACDPRRDDCVYSDIAVPGWLASKAKSDGIIKEVCYIPYSQWVKSYDKDTSLC